MRQRDNLQEPGSESQKQKHHESSECWIHSTEKRVKSPVLDDHVGCLAQAILQGHRAGLKALLESGHKADIFCYWYSENAHGGPELEPHTLRWVGELGLKLSLDVYNRPKAGPGIAITYYGGEEPEIDCTPEDRARMTLVDGEEEGWKFMDHQGVRIYRAERSPGNFSESLFSPYRNQDSSSPESFDGTDMPYPEKEVEERLAAVFGVDERTKIRIAWAIECGIVDAEGYHEKE